jgi:hypothetical protein
MSVMLRNDTMKMHLADVELVLVARPGTVDFAMSWHDAEDDRTALPKAPKPPGLGFPVADLGMPRFDLPIQVPDIMGWVEIEREPDDSLIIRLKYGKHLRVGERDKSAPFHIFPMVEVEGELQLDYRITSTSLGTVQTGVLSLPVSDKVAPLSLVVRPTEGFTR